jgi:hypothetical protein
MRAEVVCVVDLQEVIVVSLVVVTTSSVQVGPVQDLLVEYRLRAEVVVETIVRTRAAVRKEQVTMNI